MSVTRTCHQHHYTASKQPQQTSEHNTKIIYHPKSNIIKSPTIIPWFILTKYSINWRTGLFNKRRHITYPEWDPFKFPTHSKLLWNSKTETIDHNYELTSKYSITISKGQCICEVGSLHVSCRNLFNSLSVILISNVKIIIIFVVSREFSMKP